MELPKTNIHKTYNALSWTANSLTRCFSVKLSDIFIKQGHHKADAPFVHQIKFYPEPALCKAEKEANIDVKPMATSVLLIAQQSP